MSFKTRRVRPDGRELDVSRSRREGGRETIEPVTSAGKKSARSIVQVRPEGLISVGRVRIIEGDRNRTERSVSDKKKKKKKKFTTNSNK